MNPKTATPSRSRQGTYFERINFNGKAVQLLGTGGPEVTTINGHRPRPGGDVFFGRDLVLDAVGLYI
jgi:hypothetical protein